MRIAARRWRAGAGADVELTIAKLCALFSAAGTGLYVALDLAPSEGMQVLLSGLPVWAVALWIERDAQRTRVGAVHDLGQLLLIGWLFAIPWYSLKTRGGAGIWMMLGLFALIAAPIVGAFITAFALLLIQVPA
jgi:hypothetical protein